MSLDAEILRLLRRPGQEGASASQLAGELSVARSAIWARIAELRRLGYEIQSSPHAGYQLVRSPDVLHADDILSRMGPVDSIGRSLQVFQSTTSTNDVVDQMARAGVAQGAVVLAESQARGRGRLGRSWCSQTGKSLLLSVLLRPSLRPQTATQVTIAAATALARAIHGTTGIETEIKWPNDLLVEGRKIAGILTELHAELDRVRYMVLGVGVNVNQAASDFSADLRRTASSIRIVSGERADRAQLAAWFLMELDLEMQRLEQGRFEEIADEWEARCTTIGSNIRVQAGLLTVRGRAESLDEDGALLVRTQHGRLERVTGGDVLLDSLK